METIKEFKGLWWLPEDIENRASGTLIVKNNKIVLETIGVLGSASPISRL